MKRMYVIKRGNRYVFDKMTENSYTPIIDNAAVYGLKKEAKYNCLIDCLPVEDVIKVQKNKDGKLVEVY